MLPKLTRAEESAIARMPADGWFSCLDIGPIRAPFARFQALVKKGVLEKKLVAGMTLDKFLGTPLEMAYVYRLKPQEQWGV